MHKKLELAISKISIEFPFLRLFPMTWEIHENLTIPTMAVDYKNLYYNPKFVDKLSVEEVTAVLIHEIFHCVFLHSSLVDRGFSKGKDPEVFDLACEQVVNCEVRKLCEGKNYHLPGEPVSPVNILTGNVTTDHGYIYGPEFDDEDSISVYNKLIKYSKPNKLPTLLFAGDVLSDDGKETHEVIQKVIATLEMMKKTIGKLPGNLDRLLKKLSKNKIPFERILRNFVFNITSGYDDFSFTRPDTKHPLSNEIVIPSMIGYQIDPPVVVVDTSGSISQKELERFAGGIASLGDLVDEITVITTDTRVNEVVKVRNAKEILQKIRFRGGGGTDFNEVFNRVKRTTFMVFFTDGYANFPKKPPLYPVLWVLTREHSTPPWGKVAYILQED